MKTDVPIPDFSNDVSHQLTTRPDPFRQPATERERPIRQERLSKECGPKARCYESKTSRRGLMVREAEGNEFGHPNEADSKNMSTCWYR